MKGVRADSLEIASMALKKLWIVELIIRKPLQGFWLSIHALHTFRKSELLITAVVCCEKREFESYSSAVAVASLEGTQLIEIGFIAICQVYLN